MVPPICHLHFSYLPLSLIVTPNYPICHPYIFSYILNTISLTNQFYPSSVLTMKKATMSSLPREIEEVILLRLPVKSTLRFKCVCKSWHTLIYDPKFVKDQFSLTNKNPRLLMIRNITYGSRKLWFIPQIMHQ